MLRFMSGAQVGDDVFRSDPSVNALEDKLAQMFGKDAGLFCPSGTMSNQIAIKVHTNPLDEMICDVDSHVYQYEVGGYAYNSGISVCLIQGSYGKITAEQIEAAIKPRQDWLPVSRLVVLENSCNRGGGNYYEQNELEPIAQLCAKRDLRLHLDGARIFNVLVETGESTNAIGALFDSISICLSKGLGAPVGSVLIGDRTFIDEARRIRKVMGGGMRQAGYLAAAGIYAIDHHVERLRDDHRRAQEIGEVLEELPFVRDINPIKTNIIIFHLVDDVRGDHLVRILEKQGIFASATGPNSVRFVTHLDFTDAMLHKTKQILRNIKL